ncbi:MAG: dihydroorotase [Armatimonadota bacterium]|nr:MAG: dihydroorotase [Armatimonadota bacterium]
MRTIFRKAHVCDPSQGIDRVADVVVDEGKVLAIVEDSTPYDVGSCEVIDCSGLVLTPGLIDLHVHLREPGYEYKEDVQSGTQAAVAGGFSAVCCMPNTDPPLDEPSVIRGLLRRAEEVGVARVYPVAAITKGLQPEGFTEMAALKEAGAVAVTDDAYPLQLAEVLRRGMEYAAQLGLTVMTHCEDKSLTRDACMNEGLTATIMGLRGMPSVAEETQVARNCLMSLYTGCRLHILHVSTAGAVQIIRWAKQMGAPVTAETCPHYFALTDEACLGYNTSAKMNPPLRTQADCDAIIEGLRDGTIDAIATDHAPHAAYEKAQEFALAPFGIVGLETAFAVSYTELVSTGRMSLSQLVEKMSCQPAKVLGLPGGTLAPGSPADVALFDPNRKWTVRASEFRSKSRNTPFEGWELQGKPVLTMVAGKVVYHERW